MCSTNKTVILLRIIKKKNLRKYKVPYINLNRVATLLVIYTKLS